MYQLDKIILISLSPGLDGYIFKQKFAVLSDIKYRINISDITGGQLIYRLHVLIAEKCVNFISAHGVNTPFIEIYNNFKYRTTSRLAVLLYGLRC